MIITDTFASGSLAAGWSVQNGILKGQVVVGTPNVVEANTLSTEAGQIWTSVGAVANQSSSITVNALTSESSSFLSIHARWQSGAKSGYRIDFSNSVFNIYNFVTGTPNSLGAQNVPITISPGDVLKFDVTGTTITLFQNGSSVTTRTDSTYATGYPGFSEITTSNLAHVKVSSWTGTFPGSGISGTIVDSNSAALSGVTVSWTGTASGSTTTASDGTYLIPSLANGSYTVTPTLATYTFAPVNSAQTVSSADISGVNFTGTGPVATPTFSPVAGTYTQVQNVTVNDTDSGLTGFAMYYTTDGTTPTTGSTAYTGPVRIGSSLTLKVLATATGRTNSTVGSAAYVINIPAPSSPSGGLRVSYFGGCTE